jgi:hypothetical protein
MSEQRNDHLTYQLVDICIRIADSDPSRLQSAASVLARGGVPFVVTHRVLLRKNLRRGEVVVASLTEVTLVGGERRG